MSKRRMIEVKVIPSASLSVTVPLFLNLVLQIHCLHHLASGPQTCQATKVAFCLHKSWCAARLSAKPRIFTRNTLTTDVFFRLFFYDSLTSKDYSRYEISRFYRGFLLVILENS